MSKLVCPPINSEEYKKLVSLVGEYAAIRIWTKNLKYSEEENPDTALTDSLERFDTKKFPIEEKRSVIEQIDGRLQAPKDGSTSYTALDPDGNPIEGPDGELTRVSEILNKYSATKYRHVSSEPVYKETGTKFHDIIHLVGDKTPAPSVEKKLEEYGIPKKFYPEIRTFLNGLIEKGGGQLLFEKKVYSPTAGVAGAIDLIHLKADGTIDIYDFKTVYKTPKKKQNNENPWNPVGYDNGYKANRYTAQLEAYGRILEELLNQPVSNYHIVPIVVELDENDKVVDYNFIKTENGQIKTDNVMKEYYFGRSSKIIMDEVFKFKELPGSSGFALNDVDNSSELIKRLTGMGVNYNASATENAMQILEQSNKYGGKSYWNGKQLVPFKHGATEQEKLDQIIREHVDNILASDRAYAQGIQDYIETGDSKFLDAFGTQAKGLKTIFKQYEGRKDLKVIDLSTIKGLETKKGWIAVKDENNYDLYYITGDNLNALVRTSGNQEGLFAEWFNSTAHKSYLKTSLKNVLGDAKIFESVLIAMKMKQSFPEAGFGNIQLYSLYDKGSVYKNGHIVSINDHLPTVKAFFESSLTQDVIPKDMLGLLSDKKLFDADNYTQDYTKIYTHLVNQGIIEENADIKDGINAYAKSAENKKMLSDTLADHIISKVDLGEDAETSLEVSILSRMYFQINKIHQSSSGITWWKNYFAAAQNQNDPLLREIYIRKNQAIGKIQDKFWYDYKKKFEKIYDSLVKDSGGVMNAPRDFTLGDTSRYWEPLLEKKKVTVVDSNNNATDKEIFTFKLIDDKSPEFSRLTSVQQNAIKQLNELMASLNIPDWKKNDLPIIKADFYNKIYNARKQGGYDGYKKAFNDVLEDITDVLLPAVDAKEKDLSNVFLSQTGESQRNKLIGITPDNMLINSNYNNLSTNVEVMMDAFMIQGLKYEAFRDLAAIIKGAVAINTWNKTNLLNNALGNTTQHLKDEFTVTINNTDIDSKKPISKLMRSVNKSISLFALGLKPATGLVNYTGIELGLLSQSIANTVSNTGGFNLSDAAKAHAIVWGALGKKAVGSKDYEKISQLMTKFRLFNQDLASFMNGYHRVSDKTLFRSKVGFALMNSSDWMARATIMVSQMIHDGTWDAYEIVKDANGDDTLKYVESKDKRWSKLQPKEVAALKKAILDQQKEDGTNTTESLNDAYDSRYMTRMKAQANELAGAMNREDRNNGNFLWWGRMFTFFKSWLPVKIDRYINSPDVNKVMGDMVFEENEKGETVAMWKGDQMEGILYTWAYILSNIDKLIKGKLPLTAYQKNNLTRTVSDAIIVAIVVAAAKNMLEDDDDERDEYFSKILLNATGDLTAVYEMMTLDEFYYTPTNLSFIKQRINNIYNIGMGIADPDSSVLEQVAKSVPKQFEEWDIILTGQK